MPNVTFDDYLYVMQQYGEHIRSVLGRKYLLLTAKCRLNPCSGLSDIHFRVILNAMPIPATAYC